MIYCRPVHSRTQNSTPKSGEIFTLAGRCRLVPSGAVYGLGGKIGRSTLCCSADLILCVTKFGLGPAALSPFCKPHAHYRWKMAPVCGSATFCVEEMPASSVTVVRIRTIVVAALGTALTAK
jgi:hypothetical protein